MVAKQVHKGQEDRHEGGNRTWGRCGEEAAELPLPAEIQAALGELVGAAKEGLLALSVGVGLGVLAELMEAEVDEVVGPKGKHNADDGGPARSRGGAMTLGGRRVAVAAAGADR